MNWFYWEDGFKSWFRVQRLAGFDNEYSSHASAWRHFLHEDGPRMQRSLFGVLVSSEEYKKLDSSGTDSWLRTAFVSQVLSRRCCV